MRRGSCRRPSRPGCGCRRAGVPACSCRSASWAAVSRELASTSVGAAGVHRARVVELADDPVVADPPEADLGLGGRGRVADQHDLAVGRQDAAGVLGEATLEPDVDGPDEVTGGVVGRLAGVEQRRARLLPPEHLLDVEAGRGAVVEQRVRLPVALGVELEVVRPERLPLGDRGDELVLARTAQGVVRPPLLAERRAGLAGELLAARGAGAVGGEHPRRVGEPQQLVVQASGRGGGPARRPAARCRPRPGGRDGRRRRRTTCRR